MVLPNASSQSTVRRRRIQRRLSFSEAPPPLSAPGVSPVPDDAPPSVPEISALSTEESEEDDSSSSQSDSIASDENTPRTNNSAASTHTLSESQSSARTSTRSTPNTESTWAAQSVSHNTSDSSDSDEDSSDSEIESEGHPIQNVLGIVQNPHGGDGSDVAGENNNDDGERDAPSSTSGSSSSDEDPNPNAGDNVDGAQNVPDRNDARLENGLNGVHPSRSVHPGNELDSDDSSSEDEEEPADSGRRPLIRDNGAYKHTNGFIYESDESNDDGGSSSDGDDMFYNQSNDSGATASHAIGSGTGNDADNLNQGDTDSEGDTNSGVDANDAGSSRNNLNNTILGATTQQRSSSSPRVSSYPNGVPSSENGLEGHLDEREKASVDGSEGSNTDDDGAPEEVQAADAAARALERRAQERRVGQELREVARTRRRQKVSDGESNTNAQPDADADVEMKENVEADNIGSVGEELSEDDLERAAERVERDNRLREARARAERLRVQKGRVHRPRSSRRVAGIDVAILSRMSSVSSTISRTGAQRFSATRFLAKEFKGGKSRRVSSARAARSRR